MKHPVGLQRGAPRRLKSVNSNDFYLVDRMRLKTRQMSKRTIQSYYQAADKTVQSMRIFKDESRASWRKRIGFTDEQLEERLREMLLANKLLNLHAPDSPAQKAMWARVGQFECLRQHCRSIPSRWMSCDFRPHDHPGEIFLARDDIKEFYIFVCQKAAEGIILTQLFQ